MTRFSGCSLAHAALLTGDPDTAASALREHVNLCRELVLPLVADALIGFAAIAALRGDPYRAARLIGAADAHQHAFEADDIVFKALDAQFLAPVRAHYGADAWQTAMHEGRALSPEEAIVESLQEPSHAKVAPAGSVTRSR